VKTLSTPSGSAGPNASASYTTYTYDAIGRLITTTNIATSGSVVSGTQVYFDGTNPIEVRELDNSTPLLKYVWSPADGRMILRDAVAAQLSSYTGLTISGNSTGNTIQRLYPMTDGLGSIVAVADPTGSTLERYVYTVDGYVEAMGGDWMPYTGGVLSSYATQNASKLGWNWLYRGQQWVQTQPDVPGFAYSTQWCGLYITASGEWYDPIHARTLQPDLADYGNPQSNPYQTTTEVSLGATIAPLALGIGITLASGGLGAPVAIAAALGGATMFGFSSYAAGNDAQQIAQSAAIGGIASFAGGAAGQLVGEGASVLAESLGLTCANGLGMAGGFVVGAAQGAAFGATEGFVRTDLTTGNLVDAVMAGWNGGLMGAAIGGPLGAIFHEVCFTAGTLVHKAVSTQPIESQRVGQRVLTEATKGSVELSGDDATQVDSLTWRLVRLRTAKPAGSDNIVDVELLRPLVWIEQGRAVVGSQMHFELAELGIDGPADVLAIEPCPEIEPGRGRVITGTFTTARCSVLELRLSNGEVLQPTPPHRFYSETRQDWVAAGGLRIGECLRTASGQAVTVESVGLKAGEHRVYNLEVEQEHQFFVGESGVLVHNAYWSKNGVDFSHPDLPLRNGEGPTQGIFNDTKPLFSGSDGGDAPQVFASRIPELSEDAQIALSHVEGHAAAEMVKGNLSEAVLHINYETGPCDFCINGVPELIPEGSKLWVVFPQGVGHFTTAGWTRVL
jgi:hypothetical protein